MEIFLTFEWGYLISCNDKPFKKPKQILAVNTMPKFEIVAVPKPPPPPPVEVVVNPDDEKVKTEPDEAN